MPRTRAPRDAGAGAVPSPAAAPAAEEGRRSLRVRMLKKLPKQSASTVHVIVITLYGIEKSGTGICPAPPATALSRRRRGRRGRAGGAR